jgi:hypothetical protein
MIIKLKLKEYNYLINNLLSNENDIKSKLKIEERGNKFLIKADDNTINKIQELSEDHLQIVGFGLDYKLTEEGKILENIIDSIIDFD